MPVGMEQEGQHLHHAVGHATMLPLDQLIVDAKLGSMDRTLLITILHPVVKIVWLVDMEQVDQHLLPAQEIVIKDVIQLEVLHLHLVQHVLVVSMEIRLD